MYITIPEAGTRAVHCWLTGRRSRRSRVVRAARLAECTRERVEKRVCSLSEREIVAPLFSFSRLSSAFVACAINNVARVSLRPRARTRVNVNVVDQPGSSASPDQTERIGAAQRSHRSRMIVLAWCLFVIVSFLVASNQAFLNAPIPAHAVSSYSIGVERRMESNKTTHGANDNRHSVDSKSNDDDNVNETLHSRVYVIAFEGNEERAEKERGTEESVNGDLQNPLDPWSIVWYIGSFGGLVAFFLIVSCSEWCCRRGARPLAVPYAQRAETINTTGVTETPPPPYHLFAPPSYDSVHYTEIDKTSGEKMDIYVISVPVPCHRPVVQAPA